MKNHAKIFSFMTFHIKLSLVQNLRLDKIDEFIYLLELRVSLVGGWGGGGGAEGIPPLTEKWACPPHLPPLLCAQNIDFIIFNTPKLYANDWDLVCRFGTNGPKMFFRA